MVSDQLPCGWGYFILRAHSIDFVIRTCCLIFQRVDGCSQRLLRPIGARSGEQKGAKPQRQGRSIWLHAEEVFTSAVRETRRKHKERRV